MKYEDAAAAAAADLFARAHGAAVGLANTYDMAVGSVLADLIRRVKRNTAPDVDGRCARWRVRVKLFRNGSGDVRADSDPDLAVDAPGTEVISGLPGVAQWVAEICAAYHAPREVTGLDRLALEHSLKSFRPTLSRWRGVATWRPRYTVDGEEWTAAVDVRREASMESA